MFTALFLYSASYTAIFSSSAKTIIANQVSPVVYGLDSSDLINIYFFNFTEIKGRIDVYERNITEVLRKTMKKASMHRDFFHNCWRLLIWSVS
ncbi:hypothetical protein L1887_05074 [Cichorium endivia]|nr:hypothetical protein L1887_05074 [Cichorium endivia]